MCVNVFFLVGFTGPMQGPNYFIILFTVPCYAFPGFEGLGFKSFRSCSVFLGFRDYWPTVRVQAPTVCNSWKVCPQDTVAKFQNLNPEIQNHLRVALNPINPKSGSLPLTQISPRVQVPNSHILSQILTYITTIRNLKYLAIGSFGPLGFKTS